MTQEESESALKLYDELRNILYYHNKNLTKAQEWLLYNLEDFLRDISTKAYYKKYPGLKG